MLAWSASETSRTSKPTALSAPAISRASLTGLRNDGSGWKAMPGLALASVRQIAHEVLVTLEPEYQAVQVEKPGHLVIGGFELGFGPAQPSPVMPKVGRNDPCPCGSGKKFKKCCAA